MADRFDKSLSRKPLPDDGGRRGEPQSYDEDPLVELARIVSGNESFDDILGGRAAAPAQPVSRSPAASVRPVVRDTSFDLESELLSDLQSSFDPAVRPAPARPPVAAAPVRPAAREPIVVRDPSVPRESFDHMALRGGQPAAPPRAAASAGVRRDAPVPDREPYVASPSVPEFIRSRPAEPTVARQPAAPAPQPAVDDRYDDYYPEDDDTEAQYDDDQDYVDDDGYVDDVGYEPERPARSKKVLITALVVLGVVAIGGIGAYALKDRASSVMNGAPKIIAADEGPTKIQPAVQPPAETDGQQNKLIYDRANPDTASPDQLVLPDDGPVDDKAQSNESAGSREISRIILPGGPGDTSSAPDGAAAPTDAASPDAAADDADAGPRKVRTVVVKPDGTIVSSEAQPRGAASSDSNTVASAAPAAQTPAPMTAPTTDPAADAVSAPPSAPIAAEPTDAAPAATPPADTGASSTDAAKPQKDASQLAEPAATPRAATPKPAERPAETAAAPAAALAAGGGFVVQVTSQRTQEQAAAAYKNLQRKFPSVLGNRAPDIARADLGAKGVYYRARVGPMATRDEATSFCEALRAAGGDCIVQKN